MSGERIGSTERLRSIATTCVGIALSVIPLALWVAWTETVLLIVIAVGVVSATLLILLTESEKRPNSLHSRSRLDRESIPDKAVAEIHRIFPLTYHHSRKRNTRFERAMEKVARLVKRPPDTGN
jgi:hypothetical protein